MAIGSRLHLFVFFLMSSSFATFFLLLSDPRILAPDPRGISASQPVILLGYLGSRPRISYKSLVSPCVKQLFPTPSLSTATHTHSPTPNSRKYSAFPMSYPHILFHLHTVVIIGHTSEHLCSEISPTHTRYRLG